MNTKEKKQKLALDKVIKQSFRYHKQKTEERNRETIDNMMEWNRENLSPNGGKKPFKKTQKELMTKKPRGSWLTKDE